MRRLQSLFREIEPPLRLPHVTYAGTVLVVIRWLCLVISLILASFGYSAQDVLLRPGYAGIIVAAWYLASGWAAYRVPWFRRPLHVLAIDALLATAIVYLTGGYHSGFYVLFIGGVISAALYLDLPRTVWVTLGVSLLFQLACLADLGVSYSSEAIYQILLKTVILQAMAAVVGLLLEGLRREHQDAESQRVQSAQMAALNTFMQRVTASLDARDIVNTTAEAARELLRSDVALALMAENGPGSLRIAACSGLTLDLAATADMPVDPRTLVALEQPLTWAATSDFGARTSALLGPAGEHLRQLACAPLRAGDHLFGVLVVGRYAENPFGHEELPLLQALAQEATLAVRNARRYEGERRQSERLSALERSQRQMISSIAHELRTPLTCIRTSVDLLQAATSPAVRDEVIGTINHQAARLEGLVTDLLESSRLEVGQVTLTRQPTDLSLIVDRTVRSMSALIQQRGQHLDIALPEGEVVADVDRRRLEQVLTNLLANATKFTPRGGHIWLTLARQDAEALLTVADDGPGIAPEHQPFLFERSFTVPGRTAKTGLGLGLYIARQLVELHGGQIGVESAPGQGASFTVTLPLWQNNREAAA